MEKLKKHKALVVVGVVILVVVVLIIVARCNAVPYGFSRSGMPDLSAVMNVTYDLLPAEVRPVYSEYEYTLQDALDSGNTEAYQAAISDYRDAINAIDIASAPPTDAPSPTDAPTPGPTNETATEMSEAPSPTVAPDGVTPSVISEMSVPVRDSYRGTHLVDVTVRESDAGPMMVLQFDVGDGMFDDKMAIQTVFSETRDIIADQDGSDFGEIEVWAVAPMVGGDDGKFIQFELGPEAIAFFDETDLPEYMMYLADDLWVLPSAQSGLNKLQQQFPWH